jgi:hypothetical protein
MPSVEVDNTLSLIIYLSERNCPINSFITPKMHEFGTQIEQMKRFAVCVDELAAATVINPRPLNRQLLEV